MTEPPTNDHLGQSLHHRTTISSPPPLYTKSFLEKSSSPATTQLAYTRYNYNIKNMYYSAMCKDHSAKI